MWVSSDFSSEVEKNMKQINHKSDYRIKWLTYWKYKSDYLITNEIHPSNYIEENSTYTFICEVLLDTKSAENCQNGKWIKRKTNSR